MRTTSLRPRLAVLCVFALWTPALLDAADPDAVHILGLGDLKRGAKGVLSIENGFLNFKTEDEGSAQIPIKSISEFTLEQESRAKFGGTAGRLVLLAPYGSGRLISLWRNKVETVTLEYADQNDGLHGCLLLLRPDIGTDFAARLKTAGVLESPPVLASGVVVPEKKKKAEFNKPPKEKMHNAVIELQPVAGPGLAPEFRVSIYEQIFEGLWITGKFQHIYRSGDRDAVNKPDRLMLRVMIDTFQKGNERLRTLTTIGGATVIKAHITLTDLQNTIYLAKDVTGSVRAFGENIDAADNLAKRVAKVVK